MGQLTLTVTLRNARDVVMAQLGHMAADYIHTATAEARIETGTRRSVLPLALANQLGLARLRRTKVQMADGRGAEVDVTEAVEVELLGRIATVPMLVMGEHVLLGVSVLEDTDLVVDCARDRLVPNVGTWEQPVSRV
jgi:clan AA aspartic protease